MIEPIYKDPTTNKYFTNFTLVSYGCNFHSTLSIILIPPFKNSFKDLTN